MPAVAVAEALGADVIAVDVRRTADDVAVLLHDETLGRMWGDGRPVSEVSWCDVARLGNGLDRIPRLDAVLERLDGCSASLLVRLADPADAAVAVRTVQAAAGSVPVAWRGDHRRRDGRARAAARGRRVAAVGLARSADGCAPDDGTALDARPRRRVPDPGDRPGRTRPGPLRGGVDRGRPRADALGDPTRGRPAAHRGRRHGARRARCGGAGRLGPASRADRARGRRTGPGPGTPHRARGDRLHPGAPDQHGRR
ncbi:glycerophosphodiester phosphodiesterase family protein [Curtobacterium sp. MCJR17_043]|uniref:glycerophosphodiester phosphodiesterase n=1 Tax=Curtobacterium sp. MCJR17_043 TaxID=2175660 RepID=UPI0032E8FDD4